MAQGVGVLDGHSEDVCVVPVGKQEGLYHQVAAARASHERVMVAQHAAAVDRIAAVEEQCIVGDEDGQHVRRQGVGGKVARDDAVDVLAGVEREERAAVAKINGETVEEVGGVHSRRDDRSAEEHVPVPGVRLERVEESDSLHGVTPLRPAGPWIHCEGSRPVNGRRVFATLVEPSKVTSLPVKF